MRKGLTVFAAGMVALAAGACFSPSMATPVQVQILDPTQNGGNQVSITVGDMKVSVVHCQLTIAGASAACGLASNLFLDGIQSFPQGGPVTTATIVSGSGQIFSVLPGDSRTYDLSIILTATTVSGAQNINSAALAITGSADAANLADIGTSENVNGVPGGSLGAMSATLATPASPLSFAGQTKLTTNKDIFDRGGSAIGTNPLILTSVSQSFGQVPEPTSIALLLTGVASLGVFRRRRTA